MSNNSNDEHPTNEDALLDQRLFTLDHERYAAFVRDLQTPPEPNQKLKNLLKRKTPWES